MALVSPGAPSLQLASASLSVLIWVSVVFMAESTDVLDDSKLPMLKPKTPPTTVVDTSTARIVAVFDGGILSRDGGAPSNKKSGNFSTSGLEWGTELEVSRFSFIVQSIKENRRILQAKTNRGSNGQYWHS
jgi:hypothetical protein